MLKKYIGDRAFYRRVMYIAVPIMVQNFITTFVGMLDNIMVGQVGTAAMSGVSIVNQILNVLNLCLFGAVSGAGIFTAQYAGSGDDEGVRYTFRVKLLSCLAIVLIGAGILTTFGRELIMLYLKGEGSAEEAERYLSFGRSYLKIMLLGIFPFALSNVYCSTLRENGQTIVPMVAGICAVFVNLALNYILIFGKLGAPAMGVRGAAVATVISRFVELAIAAAWTHSHSDVMRYADGLYKSFRIPGELFVRILKKGMPLILNEGLWSTGMAILNQCYSIRGLEVVAATNITSTISSTMMCAVIALGNAIGIIMGQNLGAGKKEEEIMDETRKLLAFAVLFSLSFAALEALLAAIFPLIYNTGEDVRALASKLILIAALFLPSIAFTNASYFTIRSGGKTVVTFIFDSGFVWTFVVPLMYCLSRFTTLSVPALYLACQMTDLVKCALGAYMIGRRTWIQNIT